MKFLIVFTALVTFTAAAHSGWGQSGNVIPQLFRSKQQEYIYNYRSLVGTGIPRVSPQYVGLEKYGVLTVQVQGQQGDSNVLGLRLGHVTSGAFDQEVEDIENRHIEGLSHPTEEVIEKYGPVFVEYQANEVRKLHAPQGMPEDIINVYRGIAAVFTVGQPLDTHDVVHQPFAYQRGDHGGKGQPIVYRRYEQGIAGNFETIYEVLSSPERHNYLNLTKSRNYMKRVGRDGRYFYNGHDERGCWNVCPTHRPEKVERNMQPENFAWEMPATEGCPVEFHPKTDLVEAYTSYGYNMTVEHGGHYAVIEEAQGIDKKVFPLRQQQIMTVSVIKLSLVEQRSVHQVWERNHATKQYDDIIYRFPEGHKFDLGYLSVFGKQDNDEMFKDHIAQMIKALSDIIVSENIELRDKTGEKIVQLAAALGALNKQELQTLWGVLGQSASGKVTTDLEYVQRKVLIDTIGLSGSNDAAEFLVELIQQQKLTGLEAVHTFEAFQKNLVRPTVKIMNLLHDVCTSPTFDEEPATFAAACIAFSEIVRDHCASHHSYQWHTDHHNASWQQQHRDGTNGQTHFCSDQEYSQFVNAIRGKLVSAKRFVQQAIYIQTLSRLSHPDAIKALIPFVLGEPQVTAQVEKMDSADRYENTSEYVAFLRQVAIYALHHSAKRHGATVQPIVQSVYFDKLESYEIRIAALSVLLATQPTEATFGRIVIELGNEHNLEVASYAYSALYSIANSTLPCMQQSARRVQNVLGGLPPNTFGIHRSKWFGRSQFLPLANIGLRGHWQVTQSNVSAVPRAIYAGITANKGPFISTVAGFGMLTKGFEKLDNYIRQQDGLNNIVENVLRRFRRDARQITENESVERILEYIGNAMQFNTEQNNEQPRAVVSANVFGNEFYLPVDKAFVSKVIKKAGDYLVKQMKEGGMTKPWRFVRVMMPRTYLQVAPGVNGLPVVLVNRHPIVVSLSVKDLQTRFGVEKNQVQLEPFVFAVSGLIRPTVYHTSIHTAMAIDLVGNSRTAYGVRAMEQSYVSLPISAAVQYTHETRSFAFTFRPRFEKVFSHKSRATTFKTDIQLHSAEESIPGHYRTLKGQQKPFMYNRVLGEELGMALRVQGMSMNEKYAVNFWRNNVGGQQNVMRSLIESVANELFLPRTWTARMEQPEHAGVQELRLVLRVGNLLQAGARKPQQTEHRFSQEQNANEQAYPEYMRMIAYDHEYEKVTGRKPENVGQAVKRIAKQTEKYWSPVDSGLVRTLNNDDNIEVHSVEYVFSAKSRKKQPLVVTGHLILASTLTKQARLGEIKVNVEKQPIAFELQAVSAFTKAPQPFETEISEREQRGVFGFIANLKTRQTGQQQYTGKMEMTKSEQQKQLMTLPAQQKPWFYVHCEKDKNEGNAEMSSACEATRLHKAALNQVNFEIDLPQQIHDGLVSISHKAREALKAHLNWNLRASYFRQNATTNKIQGEITCSEQDSEGIADFSIRTPDQEELRFENVAFPKALQPNTMWSIKEQAEAILRSGWPHPVCTYNGQKLRTFDNVIVPLEAMKTDEEYVIARDNNEPSKFVVIGKKTQSDAGSATELVLVLSDATVIKFVPATPHDHYKVRVNQTEVHVTPAATRVEQYGRWSSNVLTLHVNKHQTGRNTLVVEVHDLHMSIVYDGRNFKIGLAGQWQKGQLVGLCGDMNGEYQNEFTGPRGCRYEDATDFVRAFGLTLNGGRLEGQWACPQGVYPREASQDEISEHRQRSQLVEEKKHEIRKSQPITGPHITHETMMVVLGDQLCYSIRPVAICEHGYHQTETQKNFVGFFCFHQDQPTTVQTDNVSRTLQSHVKDSDRIIYKSVNEALVCLP